MDLDYLVLAAHPDDAELYCGGTLLKMKDKGYTTGILDLTKGEAGTTGSIDQREHETSLANKILQPAFRENLGFPDSNLRDDTKTRKLIVDVIRKLKVKILLAPLGPCRHPDHSVVNQLARSVHFFSGAGKFPSSYSPWRPLQLIYHLEFQEEKPSFVVDISDYFEAKMEAISAYSSQFYSSTNTEERTLVGSKQFRDRMIARFKYYGTQIGCQYGEPYVVDGLIRIDDPLANMSTSLSSK